MAVERIEEYRQQNGVDILKVYCKPTEKFPDGQNYWYAPAEAMNLVQDYSWFLTGYSKGTYVIAHSPKYSNEKSVITFHKKLFEFYHDYSWNGHIDHISLCQIDNTDENLNAVTPLQNLYNKITRGYFYHKKDKSFRNIAVIDKKIYCPLGYTYKPEHIACIQQNYVEQVWLREQLGDQYYMFDFKKYRRGSEDILDLERTGQISEEEATYRHIMRYADNAWYYLRYGLEDYFKENHIPIPEYALDEQGFMVDKITRKRLCPFLL